MPTKSCIQCNGPFEAKVGRHCICSGRCVRARERERCRLHAAKFSPERRHAMVATGCAIASRNLIRQPCEICGKRRTVAHHDDYAAPLAVRWLCRSHHRQYHVKHGPGLNAFIAEEEIST